MHLLITNIILHFWVKGHFMLTYRLRKGMGAIIYLKGWFKLTHVFIYFLSMDLVKVLKWCPKKAVGANTQVIAPFYYQLYLSSFIYSLKNNLVLTHKKKFRRMRNMGAPWKINVKEVNQRKWGVYSPKQLRWQTLSAQINNGCLHMVGDSPVLSF
jgi:hypothetical protein